MFRTSTIRWAAFRIRRLCPNRNIDFFPRPIRSPRICLLTLSGLLINSVQRAPCSRPRSIGSTSQRKLPVGSSSFSLKGEKVILIAAAVPFRPGAHSMSS